jgi:hypothetical protein
MQLHNIGRQLYNIDMQLQISGLHCVGRQPFTAVEGNFTAAEGNFIAAAVNFTEAVDNITTAGENFIK